MDRRRISSLWLVPLALGGLLAGHAISYLVAAPDPHARAELLAQTGHSQHGWFETLALAAVFASVVGVASHWLRVRCGTASPAVSRVHVAGLLWALQTTGFVALETWERGHGLAGAADLLHEPAFLIGLLAQALVAVVATAIVVLVQATVAALLRLFVDLSGDTDVPAFPLGRPPRARGSVARRAWNLRGPPSPAVTRG
jgi:hypothetical protein